MTDNDNDEDEVEGNEPEEEEGGAAAPSNRNFLLALGIMGGIFLLLLIALAAWLLTRPRGGTTANIDATNQVIMTANAETAIAVTRAAALLLTPSVTATATNTSIPPTATNTQVVALATASGTPEAGQGGALVTVTPNLQTRTTTIVAVLTQNAQGTLTQAVKQKLTGTSTALPKTGFAEDVGLPGLFGMAIGLVIIIILVRRLRLSPSR
jgi:hypothetical protein